MKFPTKKETLRFLNGPIKKAAIQHIRYSLEQIKPGIENLKKLKIDLKLRKNEYKIDKIVFEGEKRYSAGFSCYDLYVAEILVSKIKVRFDCTKKREMLVPRYIKMAAAAGIEIENEREIIDAIVEKVPVFWFKCAGCGKPIKATIEINTYTRGYGRAYTVSIVRRIPLDSDGCKIALDFSEVEKKFNSIKEEQKDKIIKNRFGSGSVKIETFKDLEEFERIASALVKEFGYRSRIEIQSVFIVCTECLKKLEGVKTFKEIRRILPVKEIGFRDKFIPWEDIDWKDKIDNCKVGCKKL